MVQYTPAVAGPAVRLLGQLRITVVATLYFGWHYVADDIAGILIALIAFYLGGIASGQKFERRRLRSHPTTTTSQVPVDVDSDSGLRPFTRAPGDPFHGELHPCSSSSRHAGDRRKIEKTVPFVTSCALACCELPRVEGKSSEAATEYADRQELTRAPAGTWIPPRRRARAGPGARGVAAQVAIADDDTDVPTAQQVARGQAGGRRRRPDVDGVQQALVAANQRLEEAGVAAAQAAEAFNGARYEAKQARGDARRAAAVARTAADDVERQREAYADSLVTSYTHGSSLGALSTVVESDGLAELVAAVGDDAQRRDRAGRHVRRLPRRAVRGRGRRRGRRGRARRGGGRRGRAPARPATPRSWRRTTRPREAQAIAAEKADLIAGSPSCRTSASSWPSAGSPRCEAARRGSRPRSRPGGRRTPQPAADAGAQQADARPDEPTEPGAAGRPPGRSPDPPTPPASRRSERRRPGRDRASPAPSSASPTAGAPPARAPGTAPA